MASADKALKLRTYHFHAAWGEDYFVAAFGDSCTCLICGYVFGNNRKYNIQRHFDRYHLEHDTMFPKASPARKSEVAALKSKLLTAMPLSDSIDLLKSGPQATTILSFKLAYILANAMKPLDEGAIIKKFMITTAEELLKDGDLKDSFIAKIDQVPLSRRTLSRRVADISSNLSEQLMEDLEKCNVLSLQLGESTDRSHTAQLCVYIRMVFDDLTVTEEFLSMIPLKGRTTGADIFTSLKTCLTEKKVRLGKIVSLTTDGAPAMTGHASEVVRLWRNDADLPTVQNFHCIIHQLDLCAKALDLGHVMEPVTKIVNSIRATSTQHRLFQSLVEEADSRDLLLHTEVRWLSTGRVLDRFNELLPDIKQFLESRGEKYDQLEDRVWLQDLAFFTDLMGFINEVNLKVQAKNIPIWKLVSHIKCFHEKVVSWMESFRANEIHSKFAKLTKIITQESNVMDCEGERFAQYMQQLDEAFRKRFEDFHPVTLVAQYFHDPFSSYDSAEMTSAIVKLFPGVDHSSIRTEMIDFRHDETNRTKFCAKQLEGAEIQRFWQNVDCSQYESLLDVFRRLLSTFGSSYLCEKMFSSMQHVKSKLRSRLTDSNLDNLLRISASDYEPDFRRLANDTQSETQC